MPRRSVKDMSDKQRRAVMAQLNPSSGKRRPYSTYKPSPKPNKINIATVPLPKARNYAENKFKQNGKDLNNVLPNFDKNYLLMQRYCRNYAKDIPRSDMPVIEPKDMDKFDHKLEGGWIDIFKPYAFKHPSFPKTFKSKKAREGWVLLGQKDGNPTDDVIEAQVLRIPARDLKPLQSQIWLDKICKNIINFGKPTKGSRAVNTTIIMSKEGYILDGHHRWGQVMVSDPNLRMKVLAIPLDIKTLLKVGKSYGSAIGNKPKP